MRWGIALNRKLWVDVLAVVLMGVLLALGYRYAPQLLPVSDITLQPDGACNLQQAACRVGLPEGGNVSIQLSPTPIPLAKPFTVEVFAQGVTFEQVEIDFAGEDMNMGLNRSLLTPRGAGEFMATVTLPVCVSGKMGWKATVLLQQGRQRVAIPFRFVSGE